MQSPAEGHGSGCGCWPLPGLLGKTLVKPGLQGIEGINPLSPPSACLDPAADTAKILELTGNLGCAISSEIENR